MNTCKNETCCNLPRGSSAYCSDSCKTIYNRNKSRNNTAVTVTTVTSLTAEVLVEEAIALDSDVQRTNPTLINYGPRMTAYELERAGLKANRVPIPGDDDYSGVCEQVDGQWNVKAA